MANASAILTGSLVVISVVEVERVSRSVRAATYPSMVVGGGRHERWVVVLAGREDVVAR
ncbi:hypothetical protein J2Z30_001349 [Streptomyces iranensis]|nr:hypothetical protein [Streptomyces iranensis]